MAEQMKGKAVELELPVNEPVKEEEAMELLKFLKHSKYSVVEQLHKQLARISILALRLSLDEQDSGAKSIQNYKDGSTVDGKKGSFTRKGTWETSLGRVEVPIPKDKHDCFGLGFKPNARKRKELEKRQERRRAHLSGEEIKWNP
ncbi:hypothetical protein J1N35_013956 [Gossypium stocksii]|uniref:Uncharacterized protein n=1 Tax=Gossypium stocksii TaxID=47602 RepID=A0A9D3VTW2_9ROSI|nr:hypothetical protein J1N35_013956 [Gossypium stocksii]